MLWTKALPVCSVLLVSLVVGFKLPLPETPPPTPITATTSNSASVSISDTSTSDASTSISTTSGASNITSISSASTNNTNQLSGVTTQSNTTASIVGSLPTTDNGGGREVSAEGTATPTVGTSPTEGTVTTPGEDEIGGLEKDGEAEHSLNSISGENTDHDASRKGRAAVEPADADPPVAVEVDTLLPESTVPTDASPTKLRARTRSMKRRARRDSSASAEPASVEAAPGDAGGESEEGGLLESAGDAPAAELSEEGRALPRQKKVKKTGIRARNQKSRDRHNEREKTKGKNKDNEKENQNSNRKKKLSRKRVRNSKRFRSTTAGPDSVSYQQVEKSSVRKGKKKRVAEDEYPHDEDDSYDSYEHQYDDDYEEEASTKSPSRRVRTGHAEPVTKMEVGGPSGDEGDYDDDDYNDDYDDDVDYHSNDDATSERNEDYEDDDEDGGLDDGEAAMREASSDVTSRTTNRNTRNSDKLRGSRDVTAASTNGRARDKGSDRDVGGDDGGVGGKSMNGVLTEIFRESTPPRLFPVGDCSLTGTSLVVQCAGNLFSACVGGAWQGELKVLVEGGDGGVKLAAGNTTVVYGVLKEPTVRARPSSGGDEPPPGRWELTAHPAVRLISPSCLSCPLNIPVLRLQAGRSLCRYVVDCSVAASELLTRLPGPGPSLAPCSSPPALHARMSLTREDDSVIQPSTKVALGDKIYLRVEAEADLPETSLELLAKESSRKQLQQKKPIVDLHLHRCWVGNEQEERASLLQDGCSIVDILGNFVEFTQPGSRFSSFQDLNSSTSSAYPRLMDLVEQFSQKYSSKENAAVTESGSVEKATVTSGRVVTSRVVQRASLIAFVMNLADEKIEISCNIRVCLGECKQRPTCVTSSVNLDRGQAAPPPLYSLTRTLTITMTPNTESPKTSKEEANFESVNKTLSEENEEEMHRTKRSLTNSDTAGKKNLTEVDSSSISTEKPTDGAQTHFVADKSNVSEISTEDNGVPQPNVSSRRLVTGEAPTGIQSLPSCVPWWIFILSISVLTLVYIMALLGCVYLSNSNVGLPKTFARDETLTPTRSFFPDQSSARKRSPPQYAERYLY